MQPFPHSPKHAILCARAERFASDSHALNSIQVALKPLYDEQQQKLKYAKDRGDVKLAEITSKHVIGGMRGIPALLWDISAVDPTNGITYRGHTLQQCIDLLPKPSNANYPTTESLLWLFVTGCIPTSEQVNVMRDVISRNEKKLSSVEEKMLKCVDATPLSMHPMTQLIEGVLGAQSTSALAAQYREGALNKETMWQTVLADGFHLLSHLPMLAAYIYRRINKPETIESFRNDVLELSNKKADWAGRLSKLMGLKDPHAADALRLYMLLHADHEGGNVSAHLAHVVASAHSDLFYAYAAALCGLAGPLHGLASEESLKFQFKIKNRLDAEGLKPGVSSKSDITQCIKNYCSEELLAGRVIPGFGHAVLRTVDPRYSLLRSWGEKYAKDSDLIRLNTHCADAISEFLAEQKKVASPHPNVDCGSGCVLHHIGITELDFYPVLFGLARAIGITSSVVWARMLKLPIERPKSLTIDALGDLIEKEQRRSQEEL